MWEAADLMQQMNQDGVLPDIHTYTSFINACCKAGDMPVIISRTKQLIVYFARFETSQPFFFLMHGIS